MSAELIALLTSQAFLLSFSGTIGAIITGFFAWRVARGRARIDIESLTDSAVKNIYELADRQRENLQQDNDRLRARLDIYEMRLNELARELHTTKGSLDFVQKTRCPLAETGQCPVFQAPGTSKTSRQ